LRALRNVADWTGRALGTVFGWALFLLGCGLWGLVIIPFSMLMMRFQPAFRERFRTFTQRALRAYVQLLPFLRVEPSGPGVRGEVPCIFVVNHQSWLDPIVMIGLEPDLRGPARAYMFRVPVVRSFLKLAGFFEAEAGEPAPLDRMRQGVSEAASVGGALLFFPEGTRSRTGEIGSFRLGAFRLAVDHALPIQPVVIDGLDRVLPPGALLARRGRRYPVRVRYLPLVHPPPQGPKRRAAVRELAHAVRASMIAELERLRSARADETRA
jgi:1-acyl-sn-glycerol-3-phosphate acyltransferase